MRRFSILCSIVLLVVIGATAAIVAQQAVAASTGNDKAGQAAGQEADAVATQKGLVLDSIAKGDMVTAEGACRALLNAPTPHALHEIVEQAKALDKLPEVRQLYQNMIAARPGDPHVIWLKTGLAIASVHLGDDEAVEAMLQNIAAGHGSDDRAVEAFSQVAWACRKLQKYDKALSINQYTVDHWPQNARAAYAQQGIVLCRIALGDLAAADQALNVLIQKFGKDADASKLVLWSGFAYQDAGHKEEAYQVYGRLVQDYPDTPEAVTAQLRRAVAGVEAEDPNRMEQNIGTLLTQLAPTPDNGPRLNYLANGLFWKHMALAGKQEALIAAIDGHLEAIANYTLTAWPQSDWALTAQRDLAVVAIQRGNDPAADAVVHKMLTDHGSDPKLPEALFQIGEQHWNMAGVERGKSFGGPAKGQTIVIVGPLPALPEKARAGYSNAKRIWKRIAEDLPISGTTPQAVFFVAECCRALDQTQEAMAAYETVVDQWPDYEYAWMAQDRIVKGYKDMARLGSMSVYESEAAIATAYERMLNLFPSCPAASRARDWLSRRQGKSETQLRQEAAQREHLMNLARNRANQGGSK